MSHRDNFIKKNRELKKPLDLFNVGFTGSAGNAGVDWAGDGSNGDLTASGQTILSSNNIRNYGTLNIPSGQTLHLGNAGETPVGWILYASKEIIINGTLNVSGRGGVGGGAGGVGGAGYNGTGGGAGSSGGAGGRGGAGGSSGTNTQGGAGSSGGGAGTNLGNTVTSNFTDITTFTNTPNNWGTGGSGGGSGGGGGNGGRGKKYGN